MSDAYRWVFLDSGGGEVTEGASLVTSPFPSQADAEAWFSESWEDLGADGVASVTLLREGEAVYGPMSLDPAG